MRLIEYTLFLDALRELCPSLRLNESMASHTTFRVGGVAAMTVTPANIEELIYILTLHKEIAPSLPLCVLGKGSNVLFEDDGYDGLVIFTSELQNVDFSKTDDSGYATVIAECGASLTVLARQCVADNRSLKGLAFAYGIPGTIGGAVVMNAGAYGGEMSDVIYSVEFYDPSMGEIRTLRKDQMDFSYRHSLFSDHPEYIVIRATLRLQQDDRESIINEMAKNMTSRRVKQPLELPNAGSIFKRPEGHFAGKLIEDCGLKGLTVGGAQVSEKHAGFIVNIGGAKATDILSLITLIQEAVYEKFSVMLECEIKMISSE